MNSELLFSFPLPGSIPGGWVEPVSHLFSNTSPAILYQSIAVSLQRLKVDIDIQPLKYKIYGRHINEDGSCMTFCVRIFSNDDGNGETYKPLEDFVINEILAITSSVQSSTMCMKSETSTDVNVAAETLKSLKYVVEFQRRTGDCIQFCNIWRSVVEDLKSQVEVCMAPDYKSFFNIQNQLYFQPQSNVTDTFSEITSGMGNLQIETPFETAYLAEARKTVQCLHRMMVCEFADIQKQAVLAISQMIIADNRIASIIAENEELQALYESCNNVNLNN